MHGGCVGVLCVPTPLASATVPTQPTQEQRSPLPAAKPLRYWTVCATHWREEQRAAHHVERQGFSYYLPMVYEAIAGGDDERRTLLFPGFIFVKLREGWQSLSSTRGIASLFTYSVDKDSDARLPSRLRTDEVRRLRDMEDDGAVRLLPPLAPGSAAVVREDVGGAYAGICGIVFGTSASGRVSVSLRVMGREFRREFSRSALRVA